MKMSEVTEPLARVLKDAIHLLFVWGLLLLFWATAILYAGEPDLMDAIRNVIYEDTPNENADPQAP